MSWAPGWSGGGGAASYERGIPVRMGFERNLDVVEGEGVEVLSIYLSRGLGFKPLLKRVTGLRVLTPT